MKQTSILTALLLSSFLFLFSSPAYSQVIVIGPNSQLQWDVTAGTPTEAQSLTYAVTVDTSTTPITLTSVTCVASTPPATTQTCSSSVNQIPLGSHSITMTSSNGTVTSLPSTALTYVTIIIPVPQNVRFKP